MSAAGGKVGGKLGGKGLMLYNLPPILYFFYQSMLLANYLEVRLLEYLVLSLFVFAFSCR